MVREGSRSELTGAAHRAGNQGWQVAPQPSHQPRVCRPAAEGQQSTQVAEHAPPTWKVNLSVGVIACGECSNAPSGAVSAAQVELCGPVVDAGHCVGASDRACANHLKRGRRRPGACWALAEAAQATALAAPSAGKERQGYRKEGTSPSPSRSKVPIHERFVQARERWLQC